MIQALIGGRGGGLQMARLRPLFVPLSGPNRAEAELRRFPNPRAVGWNKRRAGFGALVLGGTQLPLKRRFASLVILASVSHFLFGLFCKLAPVQSGKQTKTSGLSGS